jgi:predicted FMN-binding regulatory protein PaiB
VYIPKHFAETDQEKLEAFIEANSFAVLVSTVSGRLFATHRPLVLDGLSGG